MKTECIDLGSYWAKELGLPRRSSGTPILAVKAVKSRRYKQKFLEDFRSLSIYPHEGVELLQIGSLMSVTERFKNSDWLSLAEVRENMR